MLLVGRADNSDLGRMGNISYFPPIWCADPQHSSAAWIGFLGRKMKILLCPLKISESRGIGDALYKIQSRRKPSSESALQLSHCPGNRFDAQWDRPQMTELGKATWRKSHRDINLPILTTFEISISTFFFIKEETRAANSFSFQLYWGAQKIINKYCKEVKPTVPLQK